ncbi:Endonuclease/exonuclease/phosphatase,Reverse transcriptase domain [Cinara cedri]|uniref:Endonuclease/exonuclease/phosphatase,Reverse transcriptase domain n=1 Tax=Cinara cedri TaxID=506608 RepID=A0A5E4NNP9_9HEMI|nr:Endonuclease/exonuclease/phosphatase,Reverse transcriptase domain [Cinara cedri]
MSNSPFTSQSLIILLWNANGLANHRNELITTLNEKRIDLALISETHFTSNTKFSIPGYTTIPANHPDNTAHAGAAIFIRSSIQFTPLPSINEDFLQAVAINIKLNHTPITMVASYCPPKHKITQTQFENFFNSLGQYFVIEGDLNAKHHSWGCHTSNPKGKSLLKAIKNKQLSVLAPPNPTYWPSSLRKRPDILDIFVVQVPPRLNHLVTNLLDPCSDHSPVLLCLDASPYLQPGKPSLINGVMDWENFRDIINQRIKLNISLKCPSDIDDAVLDFTEIIQSAAWNSTVHRKKNDSSNQLLISAHVRELITQKRKARARWQQTRLPSDKSIYNKLTWSLKRILQHLRNESFNNWIASLTTRDNSLWRTTRNCLKQKSAPTSLKKSDGTWCKSDKEKAELFCSHLSEVFKPHQPTSNVTFSETIENSLNSALPLYLAPKLFSPGAVLRFINTFPLKKSPGIDLITAESYLEDRFFAVKVGSEISNLAPILAGVPQGAISSPILFNIYTLDQPTTSQTSVADFADDKNHLNLLSDWYSNWRIKINNDKSSHITFTLKQSTVPPVYLNNKVIPSSSNVKYLGLTLDKRLTWALHIKEKRLLLNARRRALFPLIGRQAKTDLKTKLLLYKTLLKPIWLYGIQLWGAAKKSNTYKIQAFQSTSLRMITGAPPYVSNHTLHSDLKILTVHEEAKNAYRLFRGRLTNHSNLLIHALNSNSIPGNPPRRLKRNWNHDL